MRPINFLFVIVLFLSLSCEDDLPWQTIPYAPVNFTIDLNGIDHELKVPLGYQVFDEKDRKRDSDLFGFSGLLIVSDATGSQLYAFDLCCPHEDRRDTKVVPRDDGKAKCPACGSVFVTMFGLGNPESGPSVEPLQRYIASSPQAGIYRVVH